MRSYLILMVSLLGLASSACIAPSVVATSDRAVRLSSPDLKWRPASGDDLSGVFVSTELTGPLAAALRKLVYLFGSEGTYSASALLDGDPPHFEILTGRWVLGDEGLRLDGAAPATVEVAPDGSLRMSGAEGSVVLRRERED